MFAGTCDLSDFAWLSFNYDQGWKLYEPFNIIPLPPSFSFPFLPPLSPLSQGEEKKSADQFNSRRVFSHGGFGKVFKPVPLGVCWFSLRAMQPTFLPCLAGLKLCLGCNKSQPCPQRLSCSPIQLRDIYVLLSDSSTLLTCAGFNLNHSPIPIKTQVLLGDFKPVEDRNASQLCLCTAIMWA